jgi:hypothetical protein
MSEVSPIDLSLFTRQGAQTQIGFRRRARPVTSNNMAELTRSTLIAARLHHRVETAQMKPHSELLTSGFQFREQLRWVLAGIKLRVALSIKLSVFWI